MKNNGIMNPGTRHDAEEEFVLGDLLRVIAEDVWWLIGAALVVLTLGGLYCVFAKPVYVANALIKIEQANDAAPALMELSSVASAMTPLPADAEIAIMQSRDVMKDVVKKFKFDITVEPKKMPILGGLVSKLATPGRPANSWFGLTSYAWGGEVVDVRSVEVPPTLEGERLVLTSRPDGRYDLRDPDGNLLVRGTVGQTSSGNGVTLFVNQLIARPETQFSVVRINDVDAVDSLQKFVAVQERGKLTGLVDVSMESDDPAFAAEAANDLAQTYLRRHVQSKQVNAQNMLSFLKTRNHA